jgi:hypothetical protein
MMAVWMPGAPDQKSSKDNVTSAVGKVQWNGVD